MFRVIYNAVGFADAACDVNVHVGADVEGRSVVLRQVNKI